MPLTKKQTQLASVLDTHVQRITASGAVDDLVLLVAMAEYMDSFIAIFKCPRPHIRSVRTSRECRTR